jgi:hypothetical protein
MAEVVREVRVKYDLLSENQENLWNELLKERKKMREDLGQNQSGVQENLLKQSDQLLQLERKFSLLEETMKHTTDTANRIFSFIILQQRNT